MRLCVQQSAHTGQSRDFLLSGFLLFRFLILFLFEIVISMNAFQIQPYALRVCTMWETKTYVSVCVCVCIVLMKLNWTHDVTEWKNLLHPSMCACWYLWSFRHFSIAQSCHYGSNASMFRVRTKNEAKQTAAATAVSGSNGKKTASFCSSAMVKIDYIRLHICTEQLRR